MPDVRPLVVSALGRLRQMVAGETLAWALLSGVPAFASRWPTASEITSGTFAAARISQTSVTQHQSALSIDWTQVFNAGQLGAWRTLATSAKADSSVSVAAGAGLEGGGTLTQSRSIALGIPSQITPNSANGVTGNSHTHSLNTSLPEGMTSEVAFSEYPQNAVSALRVGSVGQSGWPAAGVALNVMTNNSRHGQLFFGANDLWVRVAIGSPWGGFRKVWHEGIFDPSTKLNRSGGTFTGDVSYNKLADSSPFRILADTALGADTSALVFAGGGAAGNTRGAYCAFHGSDHPSLPGILRLATARPTGTSVDADFQMIGGPVVPGGDNRPLQTIGKASLRWAGAFFGASPIVTSDARAKTEPRDMTPAEIDCGLELARLPCIYQFLDSVAEKGPDEARMHVGPTVQAVIAVMRSHGLPPFRYSFVCYDAWPETPEVIESWDAEPEEVESWPDLFNEDGSLFEAGGSRVIKPARASGSEVVQEYRPAGDRYSLRPSGLEAFCRRALVADRDALNARLTALESSSVPL